MSVEEAEINEVKATLASPGWAIIKRRIAETIDEWDLAANIEPDPFMSGKRSSMVFGVRTAIKLFEATPTSYAPTEPPDEEEFPDSGVPFVDKQEKTKKQS